MAKPCQLAIWQAPGAAIGVAIASGSLGAGECWRVVSAYATGRGSASGKCDLEPSCSTTTTPFTGIDSYVVVKVEVNHAWAAPSSRWRASTGQLLGASAENRDLTCSYA